jgi:ubiquinone biosynthesis protein UbiJ
MQIPTPFLSAIELAINNWLKLDAETLCRFASIQEKIIRLHITGLELNLYFLPTTSGIQVLGNYPSADEGGVVDATIHGSPMALIRLSTAENSGETLLKSDVEIDGDMRIAEKFSTILREVDIDWEELLSKFVGDIVAHQAGQVTRNLAQCLTESSTAMRMNASEYITEEAKLSPANAEIQYYMNQVDDVRMGVDRLAARISLLQENLSNKE